MFLNIKVNMLAKQIMNTQSFPKPVQNCAWFESQHWQRTHDAARYSETSLDSHTHTTFTWKPTALGKVQPPVKFTAAS